MKKLLTILTISTLAHCQISTLIFAQPCQDSVSAHFGASPCDTNNLYCNCTDLNQDGIVDLADISIASANPDSCTALCNNLVCINDQIADAGTDNTICVGNNIIIGGTPTATAGTPPYIYSWTPAATLNDDTIANPIATPPVTTTYIVTVTDNNGCLDTDTMTIVVNPLPVVNAGPDDTICFGDSTIIGGSPTATGLFGGFTYSWSPAGSLNDPTWANPTASPPVTTTYIVTVTDINGCVDTDTMTVLVYPLPIVDAGADDTLCFGANTVIGGSPTAAGGTPPYSYLWTPAATLDDSTFANPTTTPTVTTTYIVIVTDTNGCLATDIMIVLVNPLPVVNLGNDTSICSGDTIILDAGNAGAGYLWSTGASTQTINISSAGTYDVTVTDASGCIGRDTIIVGVSPESSTITGTIYYTGSPVTSGIVKLIKKYTTGPVTMADVDSTIINADGTYSFDSVAVGEYLVKAGGDTSLYPNAVPTYHDSTNHWQQALIIAVACLDSLTAKDIYLIDFPTMIGFGNIKGKVIRGGPGKVQGPGDPFDGIDVTLIKKPANTVAGYDGTDTNGVFEFKNIEIGNYELYVDMPGFPMDTTYTVNVTGSDSLFLDLDFCVDSTSIDICKTTSINEKENFGFAKVYPNPFHNKAILRFNNKIDEPVDIEIFDLYGRMIKYYPAIKANQLEIEGGNLNPGLYFIKLTSRRFIDHLSFIIVH